MNDARDRGLDVDPHPGDRERDDQRLARQHAGTQRKQEPVDGDVERAVGDQLEVVLAYGLARQHHLAPRRLPRLAD